MLRKGEARNICMMTYHTLAPRSEGMLEESMENLAKVKWYSDTNANGIQTPMLEHVPSRRHLSKNTNLASS